MKDHAPPSAADRTRLSAALRRRKIDTRHSLFGPSSVTWRVNREMTLLLGGGRALLMQVAHPLVAAGVAEHSHFREQPLQRLRQTLDLTLTITFADAAAALRAVRAIERVHARVHGVLDRDVGLFLRGTRYDANDPKLLFWVHATLIDTALLVYEQFVRPLTDDERCAYYEESKITARLFGIPSALIPPTFDDFVRYVDQMLHGGALAVSPAAREIAASILNPPLPLGLKQLLQWRNFLTVGLLPSVLRRQYDLSWGPVRQGMVDTVRLATTTLLPLVPTVVRALPHARRAAA